jgi:hypothetical protein
MTSTRLFEIGDDVSVPTPRSALFRKRSASQDRTSGKVVGYESGGGDRSKGDDWWYDVKLAWDEPWVSISQTELLKLNPRNGGDQF